MSATEPAAPKEGADVAGEYVLGVLSADERAAAARRIAEDPGFAAAVAAWEDRLIPLVEQIAAVEPPAGLWPAIAVRIGGKVVTLRPRTGAWNNVALWRGLTAASAALAAACLVLVVLPKAPTPPPTLPAPPSGTVAVARLDAPKGGAVFVASYDETKRQLIVTPVGRPAPADRSPELWLMPDKAKPVPIGVFMREGVLVVPAPSGLTAESLLGVSLEPAGGSPTGQPTGPVIAVGKLMRL